MPAVDEIYASFLRGIEQGELLDLDLLCERHPEHADELRRLHNHYGLTILPGAMALHNGAANVQPDVQDSAAETIDDPQTVDALDCVVRRMTIPGVTASKEKSTVAEWASFSVSGTRISNVTWP